MKDRLCREKATVSKMIEIYCKGNHHSRGLCSGCEKVRDYALARIDHCKHGENKDFCSNCDKKCYNEYMGENIRTVMRYSGPRMIYHNPVMAIRHILSK